MENWFGTAQLNGRQRLCYGMAFVLAYAAPVFAQTGADQHMTLLKNEIAVPGPTGCSPSVLAGNQHEMVVEPAAGPEYFSKSAAILGGMTSSLDRIRSAQSGTATTPLSRPMSADATVSADCVSPTSPTPETANQAVDEHILGSLRLSVTRTPFDDKWDKIASRKPALFMRRWLVRSGAHAAASDRIRAEMINRWANARITYTDDINLYGKNDYWASSRETLARQKGDCEDYAILKMDMLATAGIDRSRMSLVIARDLVRNADHAVLVVQLENGPVMLDNATDTLLDGRLANDYRPIMSFASNGKWLHGYSTAVTPPTSVTAIAMTSVPSTPAIVLSTPVLANN
jgi:predicted transglutaminase-like cysteine proteinase